VAEAISLSRFTRFVSLERSLHRAKSHIPFSTVYFTHAFSSPACWLFNLRVAPTFQRQLDTARSKAMDAPNFLNQNFSDDEDEDDDFNPVPAAGSDDEVDAEPEENEQPQTSRRPSEAPWQAVSDDGNGGKLNGHGSTTKDASRVDGERGEDYEGEGEDLGDEEEEEEDDEEEDDDDEEAISGRPRKRRRRGGLNPFIEEEAEVDEDDDAEDDEDDEGIDGFVANTHPDDLDQLPEGTESDDRRHRELDRRREIEASMDAEKTAQALKERYGRNRPSAQSSGVFIPQNLLMPSVDDPSIWSIKCKPGKEREVIQNIAMKMAQRAGTKQAMKIFSAFERGGGSMAGFIFVEARKKADVDAALDGILNVYPRTNPTLVPVKEMPDLLRVQKSQELVRDGYVRIKRGLYQGDLAMIQEVESNGLEVTVRLVPRLTYGMDEDDKNSPVATHSVGADGKRKRLNAFGNNSVAARPPQRLFSESEAKKKHGRFLTPGRGLAGRTWTYKNETYEDGFLIKDFKLQHLITQDVNPRLDEITKLTRVAADGTETLDLESLAHSLRNNTADGSYMPGDEVEVYTGEQKGIVGKTEGVSGNIVSIKVSEGELTGQIVDVPMKGLRKRFNEGDHVKVVGGSRYKDEVGMVLKIKDDRVTVLVDASMQEITVFSKDLREATDSGGSAGATKYDVHDLVQLE
jgi:transcription elongation factor SPT5